MPRNVEIKARLTDPEDLRRRADELASDEPHQLCQHDTFFRCQSGRLKLRRFAEGGAELIAYSRPDDNGPRTSNYQLVPCSDPEALHSALSEALGVLGEVRKQRTLWLVGRARVHLDKVDGLGWFVELEVVLSDDDRVEEGESEVEALMESLAIEDSSLVPTAYLDLILQRER